MKLVIPILLATAALAVIAEDAPKKPAAFSAAIVVNKSDYPTLKPSLDVYAADVSARWPGLKIQVLAENDWKSAAEIRAALKTLAENSDPKLEGAMLVGNLPIMRFRTTLHPEAYGADKAGMVAVCPMYFQDLDGSFDDTDGDGILEAKDCKQGTHRGAEIWVSFVPPSVKDHEQGLKQLQRFFAKTHRYYSGEQKYNGRALLWQTLDIEKPKADVKELAPAFGLDKIDLFSRDETEISPATGKLVLKRMDLTQFDVLKEEKWTVPVWKYHSPMNPLVDQLFSLSGNFYDLYEVHYGGGCFHAYLSTGHVRMQRASPKIVCMNACRTGQFDYMQEQSIALAYLYDTAGTLAAMGPTVEASWSQLYNLVDRHLVEGDYLGRAWLRKDQLSTLTGTEVCPSWKPAPTNYHDHTIPEHGAALLGDPFVRLKE